MPLAVLKITPIRLAGDDPRKPLVGFSVLAQGDIREGEMIRLPLRIATQDGSPSFSVMASGPSPEKGLALLYGQAELFPGTWRATAEASPSADRTFRLPKGNDTVIRNLCPHGGADPTYVEQALVGSRRGEPLTSVSRVRVTSCCLQDILKKLDMYPNMRNLDLLEPIGRPLGLKYAGSGAAIHVPPGHYAIVNPSSRATCFPVKGRSFEYRGVGISRPMWQRFRDAAGIPAGAGPFDFDPAPRRMTPALKRILARFEKAHRETDPVGREFKVSLACHELLMELMERHPNRLSARWREIEKPEPARMDPRLMQALRYLDAHYAEPLRVRIVAMHASMSPSLLWKMFRAVLDQSPNDYLQNIRMEKAKELLGRGGLTVKQIARSVGYGSPRSFRRVFQAHTRRQVRNYRT